MSVAFIKKTEGVNFVIPPLDYTVKSFIFGLVNVIRYFTEDLEEVCK